MFKRGGEVALRLRDPREMSRCVFKSSKEGRDTFLKVLNEGRDAFYGDASLF